MVANNGVRPNHGQTGMKSDYFSFPIKASDNPPRIVESCCDLMFRL
jgi:hypothetical protein